MNETLQCREYMYFLNILFLLYLPGCLIVIWSPYEQHFEMLKHGMSNVSIRHIFLINANTILEKDFKIKHGLVS